MTDEKDADSGKRTGRNTVGVRTVGLVLVGVLALWLAHLVWNVNGGVDVNPYEYDISEFREVPDELMGFKETGSFPTGLDSPGAIAAGPGGRVYVSGKGTVKSYGPDGTAEGSFSTDAPATCLAVDADGTIYAGLGDRVEVFDSSGERKSEWASLGENALITSVAVGTADVFVAEFDSRLVWRFDKSGALKGQFGQADEEQGYGGLLTPSAHLDVALGKDGSLWIVNPGRQRVEQHSAEGGLKTFWGKPSMELDGFCGCCNPVHIAILADGSFVTAEKGLPRIKIYDASGELKTVVAGPLQFGEGVVVDFAVVPDGTVFVLDPSRNTVRIFKPKEEAR